MDMFICVLPILLTVAFIGYIGFAVGGIYALLNKKVKKYRNPTPTVDIIALDKDSRIMLIKRKNAPLGWALPGGFVDLGESCPAAAVRELMEETTTPIEQDDLYLHGVYSDPKRDPRQHNISITYVCIKRIDPKNVIAGDDAAGFDFFRYNELPELAFDHAEIINDFYDKEFIK